MTDVKKDSTRTIATPADARDLYAPPPAAMTGMMGVEVEMALYRVDNGSIRIPSPAVMAQLQTALRDQGHDAQLEAAGVLEYASRPAKTAKAGALLADVARDLDVFTQTVNAAGYTVAPYSILPTTTRDDALKNMASRERLVTSIGAMHKIFPKTTVEIPLLTAGIQTSFSPADADEMFAMTRRAYLLTPILIALANASAGFVKNGVKPVRQNYRMRLYDGYSEAGGISPAFKKAVDGKSFIDAHIDAVFAAPMHFAYRPDGTLEAASPENPLTFAGLVARGWNTQSNYELAESFLYNDIKICNLRDAKGNVMGKRMEVRAADAGPRENVARAVLLTAALVPAGPAADAFEALCGKYGFTGTPADMAELLETSRNAAIDHNGKFTDVAYGTGHLRDFCQWLAPIVQKHYAGDATVNAAQLEDLCGVLRSGQCPAALTAAQSPTLGEVTASLKAAAKPVQAGAAAGRNPRASRPF